MSPRQPYAGDAPAAPDVTRGASPRQRNAGDAAAVPGRDCPLCARLVEYRQANRAAHAQWHNAPVPAFGPEGADGDVALLIVGLAPGLRGANRTGRPLFAKVSVPIVGATPESPKIMK